MVRTREHSNSCQSLFLSYEICMQLATPSLSGSCFSFCFTALPFPTILSLVNPISLTPQSHHWLLTSIPTTTNSCFWIVLSISASLLKSDLHHLSLHDWAVLRLLFVLHEVSGHLSKHTYILLLPCLKTIASSHHQNNQLIFLSMAKDISLLWFASYLYF